VDSVASSADLSRPVSVLRSVGRPLRTHGLLIGCVGIFTGVIAARLPKEILQDTWLSLLVGRRIANHGLPHHDVLTAWTLGKDWVDQQWLAHLLAYGLYAAGGLIVLAVCHVLLLGASVGGAVAFARRSGVTARTTAWLLVACIYPILLAAGGVRTQSFVLPLYVAVLALLIRDARAPSNRVFLTLPLLALWANMHGSVVVGAGLVALRGIVGLAGRQSLARNVALVLGALASVLATPYGYGVLSYYRHTLINPAFRSLVTEWGPPTPSLVNAPIFLLIAAAIWLLARYTKLIATFGVLAELMLIVLSLGAIRSVVWLGLGSLMLLAPALDVELRRKELSVERMNKMVAIVGIYFVALILIVVVARGDSGLSKSFPTAAGLAVARAAAADPSTHVYSNERFADWLLFEHPELTGRVDFDARFELLSPPQLQRIFNWTNQITDHWRDAVDGSRIIVLDLEAEQPLEATLARSHRLSIAFKDSHTAVFVSRRN
jgi:hypothetical protein